MNLEGKAALVTGGARRIGGAISRALAAKGARVAIHYRTSRAAAEALAAELPGASAVGADLAEVDACERLVYETRPDVLVNSAAVYERLDLGTVDAARWDRTIAVNLRAPFFLSRAAGTVMKGRGAGAIVNLGDWAALRPYPGYLPYFASKAGLLALTAGLARELAPEVRVNTVALGPVLLPPAEEGRREAVERATLLGRLGGPESVVSAVLFVLENDFLTGQTITLDGGRSLR
jgi:pteridine reductase